MDYILIDLDGTITNPKEGITKSVQYALRAMGIFVEDLDSLTKHIGPPLKSGFVEFYNFTEAEAELAVKKYREYYMEQGILENVPYAGIEQLLSKWKQDGKIIIVATSKPEELAVQILEHFHLKPYFDDICGATFDEGRSEKAEVIRYAIEKNKIMDLSQVVMVGDRKYDILGAKAVGIASVGVLYGFGDREEMEAVGAEHIAEDMEELYEIVRHL